MKQILVGQLVDSGYASIQTGPFGTQFKASEYTDSGRPVLNVKNVGFGDVRTQGLAYTSDETAERLRAHILGVGDIVFGRKGAVERHAFIGPAFAGALQGSDCIRLRLAAGRMLPRFASFALRTRDHQAWMQAQCSHGATMASLNQDIVRRIRLPDLPMSDQVRATQVLGTLDDLIENNGRRIVLLEQMAQVIYREWFVHFRYPGHEHDKLVDSSLGIIPSTWLVSTVGREARNFDRARRPLSGRERRERPGPYTYYGAAKPLDLIDGYLFDGDYLLVAEDGSVITTDGFPVLQRVRGKFWVSNHAHILQGGERISTTYLQRVLERYPIAGHVTGAAQPKVTQANLNRIPILVPPHSILLAEARTTEPLVQQLFALDEANIHLRQMRDLLLPRLVSGQIDVSRLYFDAVSTEAVG